MNKETIKKWDDSTLMKYYEKFDNKYQCYLRADGNYNSEREARENCKDVLSLICIELKTRGLEE